MEEKVPSSSCTTLRNDLGNSPLPFVHLAVRERGSVREAFVVDISEVFPIIRTTIRPSSSLNVVEFNPFLMQQEDYR